MRSLSAGPENLHRVRRVDRGTRYVLAMWFTCSERHQYVDDDDATAGGRAGSGDAVQPAVEADAHVGALRLVNEELLKANDALLRSNRQLQRKVDSLLVTGAGDGGRAAEAAGQKQGELLQEMALKRRLSAEVEFAKLRLQAALAHDRQAARGVETGVGAEGGHAPGAEARGAQGRRSGSGGVGGGGGAQRCFDLESCAAASRQSEGVWVEEAGGGLGWP